MEHRRKRHSAGRLSPKLSGKKAGVLAAITCQLSFAGTLSSEKTRPNVLMFCIDDLNNWVGFMRGHPQTLTPNMDYLAKNGVIFSRAYCPAPACSPSRNAILFGVESFHSGLYPFYEIKKVDPSVLAPYTSLPQLFHENGYYTCGLTKVFHNPDNTFREKDTWDEYTYYQQGKLNLIPGKGYDPDPAKGNWENLVGCPASNLPEDFQDRQSALHAVRFLQQKHNRPFFLGVGFILPHVPLIAPEENFDRFPENITAPPILDNDLNDVPVAGQSNARISCDYRFRADHAWEQYRRAYLACTSFTDDNIGLVLNALNQSPYASNTIVVLWSDNGFHLGEKRTHSKFSLWEESTHVPFVIWDPRNHEGNGKICNEPTSLIDIYATLCDLIGLTPPGYIDGKSIVPWLKDPSKPKQTPAVITWGRGNHSVRTKEWCYNRYFDGSEELYNTDKDPHEWTNLASNPEYTSLKEELATKWLPKTEAPQVTSGKAYDDVADADNPTNKINSFKAAVEYYTKKGMPPLD